MGLYELNKSTNKKQNFWVLRKQTEGKNFTIFPSDIVTFERSCETNTPFFIQLSSWSQKLPK